MQPNSKLKRIRKAFTIVELVIVIAVIAILAAVLIPTFINVVNKANQSADIQACRQMNTYLTVNEVTEAKNYKELQDTLKEGGMDVKDYKPLSSGCYFFWDSTLNRIMYTDSTYTVIYPDEYKGEKYESGTGGDFANHQWYSLSGEISNDVTVDSLVKDNIKNNTATINDGNSLVTLMNAITENKNESVKGVTTITLSGTIDMQGAGSGFGLIGEVKTKDTIGSENTVTGHENGLTIGGSSETDKATIKGLVVSNNTYDSVYGNNTVATSYGYGLLGEVKKDTTVKNLVIDGANIYADGDGLTSGFGIIAGKVTGCTLTIENVTIKNCYVNGYQKVGALVGQVQGGGKVVINGVMIENTTVAGVYQTAQVVGQIGGKNDTSSGLYFSDDGNEKSVNIGDKTVTVGGLVVKNVTMVQLEDPNPDYTINGYVTDSDTGAIWIEGISGGTAVEFPGVAEYYYWRRIGGASGKTNYYLSNDSTEKDSRLSVKNI